MLKRISKWLKKSAYSTTISTTSGEVTLTKESDVTNGDVLIMNMAGIIGFILTLLAMVFFLVPCIALAVTLMII